MDEEDSRRLRESREWIQRSVIGGDREFSKQFFSTDISTEELIQRYESGERNFCDIGLTRLDLSNVNLAGVNLAGAKLRGANLTGANLADANLSHAYLICANLTRANLSGANLTWAILVGANLENTNLRGSTFRYVQQNMAVYCNTIMPDGSIEVGPYTYYG